MGWISVHVPASNSWSFIAVLLELKQVCACGEVIFLGICLDVFVGHNHNVLPINMAPDNTRSPRSNSNQSFGIPRPCDVAHLSLSPFAATPDGRTTGQSPEDIQTCQEMWRGFGVWMSARTTQRIVRYLSAHSTPYIGACGWPLVLNYVHD